MTQLTGVRFGGIIAGAAKAHGLDPTLLAAVAAQESGGPDTNSGRNIVGDYGHGHGVFQIDDRYHGFAQSPAAMNVAKNADYAAGMLKTLIAKFGDVRSALSAYNAGSPHATGTKTTWADGTTLGYADSVMRHLRALAADPALQHELVAGRADDAHGASGLAGLAGRSAAGGSNLNRFAGSAAAAQAVGAGPALVSPAAVAAPPVLASSAGLSSPAAQSTWQYRSYQSEVGQSAAIAQDSDKKMAALIDPSATGDDAA